MSGTMRERSIAYLAGGAFQTLAFTAWGDPHAEPVICVHGLSRNGRDFDPLAGALAERYYVLCPDLPGRGRSSWLPDPALYAPPTYVLALSHLLAFVDRPVRWVGTSLGGICGMLIAAAANQPITRIVLNDIGPFVPKAALARIRDYLAVTPDFEDIGALEAHLRRVHAPFGNLTDAQWTHLATHSHRTLPNGRLTLHYDPAITQPLRDSGDADLDLWPFWARIAVPMLAIRGESSDLLLPDTFERMQPKAEGYVVETAGHAPALMDPPTIGRIEKFLEG